jgi:hypothetical protein
MAPQRRPRLPEGVAAHLPTRDRVLAAAPLVDTGPDASGGRTWAVATVAGVAVVAPAGVRWRRDWVDVDHAAWSQETESLTVTWVDGSAARTLSLAPDAGRRFPEAFRDRVQASVVHVERRSLPGLGELRAIVRRTADGGLLSQLVLPATRALTSREQEAADDLESRARVAVGLDA